MKAASAQAVSCCVYAKPQIMMQHMDDIIPYMFDCWAAPVVHLLLLKSSLVDLNKCHLIKASSVNKVILTKW